MAKLLAVYDTDSERLEGVTPDKSEGIAIPAFTVSATRPPTGVLVGEAHYQPSNKHLSVWTQTGWLDAVPESLKLFADVATMNLDTTSALGTPGVISSTGEMFVKVAGGWRSSVLRRYPTIAEANADTLSVDGSLGWLVDQQVMVYKDAGAWQRLVDTPHVTVAATKPTNPLSGDINFNATTKVAEIYDGSAWNPMGSGVKVSEDVPTTGNPGEIWYRPSDTLFRIYNGGSWTYPGSKAFSGTAAPTGTFSGQLWYDTNKKTMSVWDGATNAWLPVAPGAPTAQPATPKIGDLYFNPTSNALQYYNGTTWKDVNQTAYGSLAPGQANPNTVFAGPWKVDEDNVVNVVSGIFKHNTAGGQVSIVLNGMAAVPGTGNMIRHVAGAPSANETWNPFDGKTLTGGVVKPNISKWSMGNSFLNQFLFFVDRRFGIHHWGWIARQPENGESICIMQGVSAPTTIQLEGTAVIDGRLLRTTSMQIPF